MLSTKVFRQLRSLRDWRWGRTSSCVIDFESLESRQLPFILSRPGSSEWQVVRMASEVAFIGGSSGVGKTSVGFEMHAQLRANDVAHCVIDGDFLDLAHPTPWEHGLAERNRSAMWANYQALGYNRFDLHQHGKCAPHRHGLTSSSIGPRRRGGRCPADVYRSHRPQAPQPAREGVRTGSSHRIECADGGDARNRVLHNSAPSSHRRPHHSLSGRRRDSTDWLDFILVNC